MAARSLIRRIAAAPIGSTAAPPIGSDYSGPGPHGRGAGIAVFLHPSLGNPPWHVVEWGTITINPLATAARRVNRGETLELAVRIVAHDGDRDQAGIAELYEAFKKPR